MSDRHRITLIPATVEMLKSILTGADDFYSKYGIFLPSPYTDFPESLEYTIKQLKENPSNSPFQSFAIITKDNPTYIGQTGFIAPPDENGLIEFGYEIASNFRGRGYADEAAKLMIKTAFETNEVKSIIAHTLNIKNASNHILIKNNFVFDEVVMSAEDGTVWKWKLTRKMYLFKQLF